MHHGNNRQVWQQVLAEYNAILTQLVLHPRWDEALTGSPRLEQVVTTVRRTVLLAGETHRLLTGVHLTMQEKAEMDIIIAELQEGLVELRAILADLGEPPQEPPRLPN